MLYGPMVSRGVRLAPLVALALSAMAGSARAQIGTGWVEYFPMKNIQLRGAGAKYTNENGIETFSTQPGDERSEARIVNDHRTGTWQFEGWVNVKAGVNGGCIHQVFKFLMIVAYPNDGGEFRQHSYQKLAATGMYDKWVRVNTIHDPGAGKADVYIDGTWRGMTESKSPGPEGWYHKYGIYNSSGTRPVVQWRNVRFFKDGKGGPTATASDGGPPAPPPSADGGSPDLRIVDMGEGADTGGAGTGGTTGSAGSSGGGAGAGGTGAGGSGGVAGGGGTTGGSGGSPPNTTGGSGGGSGQTTGGTRGGSRGGSSGGSAPPVAPDPASAGCGCRVDGTRGSAALALPLALGLLALARRRRRRR
jgi:MYXO-CTERM domain-containing protein